MRCGTTIVSELEGDEEPLWFRPTVERLMSALPEGYSSGLSSIVLTSTALAMVRKGKQARRNRGGTPLGRYHRAWNSEAAWIEIVVDQVVKQMPPPLHRLPIARDLTVARVLFHEIGHHLDATLGSVGRTGEHGAEAWESRLSRAYFRRRYTYLRPLLPVIRIVVRAARRGARRRTHSREVRSKWGS
jgi:hypothetical protein